MARITADAFLSDALMFKQIEAIHGAPIFTLYSYLDPQLAERQVNTAFGSTIFSEVQGHQRGLYDTRWTPASLTTALGGS